MKEDNPDAKLRELCDTTPAKIRKCKVVVGSVTTPQSLVEITELPTIFTPENIARPAGIYCSMRRKVEE